MSDPLHRRKQDALARQLEQERRELKNAPVIAVHVGPVMRCHHCGTCTDQLYELAAPVHPQVQYAPRMLCRDCHPESRKAYWKHEGRYDAESDRQLDDPLRTI